MPTLDGLGCWTCCWMDASRAQFLFFYPYLWVRVCPLFFMIHKWRHRIVACFFGPKPAPISERMHVVPVRVCNFFESYSNRCVFFFLPGIQFFQALFEPVRVFFSCRVSNFFKPYSNQCVFFFLSGKQFFQALFEPVRVFCPKPAPIFEKL